MNFLARYSTLLAYVINYTPSILLGVQTYQAISFSHNSSLSNTSQKIKEELEPFLKKMNVREDLIFLETSEIKRFFTYHGTNYFTRGDGVIYLPPSKFCDNEKYGCNFFIKRTIIQMEAQEMYNAGFIPISLTTTFLYAPKTPQRAFLYTAMHLLGLQFIAKRNEGIFDDIAIAESSIEELKGGRRISILQQPYTQPPRQLSKELVQLVDQLFHNRIQKIEFALKQRNAQIEEEQKKMPVDLLNDTIKTLFLKRLVY